jgi:hypothetical protein
MATILDQGMKGMTSDEHVMNYARNCLLFIPFSREAGRDLSRTKDSLEPELPRALVSGTSESFQGLQPDHKGQGVSAD